MGGAVWAARDGAEMRGVVVCVWAKQPAWSTCIHVCTREFAHLFNPPCCCFSSGSRHAAVSYWRHRADRPAGPSTTQNPALPFPSPQGADTLLPAIGGTELTALLGPPDCECCSADVVDITPAFASGAAGPEVGSGGDPEDKQLVVVSNI